MALAGTAPRGNSAQEDIILGEQLLHNMNDIIQDLEQALAQS